MTDKKDPTLTPEWFASLLSRPSMRGTSAEMDERAIPRDTEGNPLPEAPGHRKELEEGLPVPIIDEFGTMSVECAKAVGTLIEGASDEPYVHDVDPSFGGGGMSVSAVALINMHRVCEELLTAGLVTKHEMGEFAESLFRLIRK